MIVSLGRVTPIVLARGGDVVITGSAYSSIDGSTTEAPQLFDLEAGGLRVLSGGSGAWRVEAMDGAFPGCTAAGVSSPCLVPRLKTLAHDKLVTEGELAASLTGTITMETHAPPAPPVVRPDHSKPMVAGLAVILAALAAILIFVRRRARKETPLGQVELAARGARKATAGDLTLAAARAKIDDLLSRAELLEKARKSCVERLANVDRRALEARRAAWAKSGAADAEEAVAALTAESAELARIEADHAASVAGLERIAASLRVLAMKARAHRGMRARVAKEDPVDAVAMELDLRDEALAEADRAV